MDPNMPTVEAKGDMEIIAPTIRQRLQRRHDQLHRELKDVESAMTLLDENPKFEAIHDAITKVQRHGGGLL